MEEAYMNLATAIVTKESFRMALGMV